MAAMKLDRRVPEEIDKRKRKIYGVLQLIGVSIHMQILEVNTQGAWCTIFNVVHIKTHLIKDL